MPRPTRAQGRPGTRVIPTGWSKSHAPVAKKTMTGRCEISLPGDGRLVLNKATGISERPAVAPTYDDVCRIQVLNAQDSTTVVAEQTQTTIAYLVAISLTDEGANDISLAHVVHVTECTEDPSLVGKRLLVTSVVRGTERFQRDLFCVEDQSTPTR